MHSPPNVPRWRRYLRFWRPDAKADVEDELQFHLQEHVDDLVARGMDPQHARIEAVRRFGDIKQIENTMRELAEEQETRMRRSEMLGVLKQDAIYGFRMIRANPGFAAAIALTLALGIGATTAIFSVVNSVLLRPLPYDDSERLVIINERFGEGLGNASAGHFHDWSEQSQIFTATAAYQARTFQSHRR